MNIGEGMFVRVGRKTVVASIPDYTLSDAICLGSGRSYKVGFITFLFSSLCDMHPNCWGINTIFLRHEVDDSHTCCVPPCAVEPLGKHFVQRVAVPGAG